MKVFYRPGEVDIPSRIIRKYNIMSFPGESHECGPDEISVFIVRRSSGLKALQNSAFARIIMITDAIPSRKLKGWFYLEEEKIPDYLVQVLDLVSELETGRLYEKNHDVFLSLFDNTFNMMSVLDVDGRIISINRKIWDISGITSEEVRGAYFWDIKSWSYDENVRESLIRHFSDAVKGEITRFSSDCLASDGETIRLDVSLNPVCDGPGEIRYVIAEAHDVSEITRYESDLEETIRQKDELLKEIHHRVKNNMQIISSLLNMQSRLIVNDTDKSLFLESQNRIKAMALVHEKIYQSKNLSEIDYSQYVHQLIDYYSANFPESYRIRHVIDIADIRISIDEAIPLSLIINEIVTNSLKYAFPEAHESSSHDHEIYIKMYKSREKYILHIGDNGCGFGNEEMFYTGNTLGFQLIRGLVRQLKGTVKVMLVSGCEYSIILPIHTGGVKTEW